MKAVLVVVMLLFCATYIQAQKNQCDCETFLSTEYSWQVHVYNNTDKDSVLYAVGNNAMDEDFVHFTVLAQKGQLLKVAPYSIHKWYDTGWIDNAHVAVYGRNYDHPLNIYKKADSTSSVVFTVPVHYEPEYHVTGCKGRWLQVEFVYEEQPLEGWLSPDDQCGSAYTNCN